MRLWKINYPGPGCSFYEFYDWYIFQQNTRVYIIKCSILQSLNYSLCENLTTLMILIYIIDDDFLDIDLFFNQDKKIKIDMRINYFLRQSIFSLLGENHL